MVGVLRMPDDFKDAILNQGYGVMLIFAATFIYSKTLRKLQGNPDNRQSTGYYGDNPGEFYHIKIERKVQALPAGKLGDAGKKAEYQPYYECTGHVGLLMY